MERISRMFGNLCVLDSTMHFLDIHWDRNVSWQIWPVHNFCITRLWVGNNIYSPMIMFSFRIIFWLKLYEGPFSSRNCTVKSVNSHITFNLNLVFHKNCGLSKSYKGTFFSSVLIKECGIYSHKFLDVVILQWWKSGRFRRKESHDLAIYSAE